MARREAWSGAAMAAPVDAEVPDIVVTSLADSGTGSLRQAIADAPVNGTIGFALGNELRHLALT